MKEKQYMIIYDALDRTYLSTGFVVDSFKKDYHDVLVRKEELDKDNRVGEVIILQVKVVT